jgi:beta-lactamase superfamily II metal-dependent hydrolase
MGNVKIRVWDVKYGNAIYVRTPNDKHLVYDLGRGDYSENSNDRSPLQTLSAHYKISHIHYLMVTHPHRDHIDDILNINMFTLGLFHRPVNLPRQDIMSGVSERDRAKYDKFFAMDDYFNGPVGADQMLSNPYNYGGVDIKTFQTPELTTNLNNLSILSVLTYDGMKIIIPGDNEFASLENLMKNEDFRIVVADCDILIAPHHGRESAYHSGFVKLANPRLTIVSDGSLCDTSANSRYSAVSRGWNIYKKGQQYTRKMLSTNSDGEVYIDFGRNANGRYLYVEIK